MNTDWVWLGMGYAWLAATLTPALFAANCTGYLLVAAAGSRRLAPAHK